MRIRIRAAAAVLGPILALAPHCGSAQAPVWRCGSSYADHPCTGGKPIDAEDTRTIEQQRESDRAAREMQGTAARMERERIRFEAVNARRGPVLLDSRSVRSQPSSQAKTVHKQKKKRKGDEPEYFSARAAGPGPERKSSSRTSTPGH